MFNTPPYRRERILNYEHNSVQEAKFLSSGGIVDGRHSMFEVTQAMVAIKVRFSLNKKLNTPLV